MKRTVSTLFLAAALGACGGPADSGAHPTVARITDPGAPPADVAALVTGNTELALALHQTLATQGTNLFYSPYGISLDLAMLDAQPLNPDMQAGIDQTMHFTLPSPARDIAFDALDLALTGTKGKTSTGKGKQFALATAIWSAMGEPATYLATLGQYYGVGVLGGDNPGKALSDWQATLPGPKLPFELAGPADMALVNVVNFDAAWQTKFDTAKTQSAVFHAVGSDVSVPFMNQETALAIGQDPPAIEVPYDGGALSLLVIVPSDLNAFEKTLTADSLAAIVAGLQTTDVSLSLPKLKLQSSWSVLPQLQSLGLPLDSGHWQIWHSAILDVSEAGTTAEAMTTVSHTPNAVQTPTPFVVDRPFLLFIRDRATGTILFTGRVVDPSL